MLGFGPGGSGGTGLNAIDEVCINTLRFLAVDAVEAAKSGHPGLPLGAAPAAYVVWDRFLRHNPQDPTWFNRDRFVLSAGHGSALLYALLHTAGYDLPLEELKRFRQWGSRTPGHPEYGLTPGVEATTGPLGQGFAMAVGMALAERALADYYNRADFPIVDHSTYVIVSDGDLMEGVSHEAASLAGTLGLGKLIYLYDDNGMSIEGSTDMTFTEDVAKRFDAYGWHVQKIADANDVDAIAGAIRLAREEGRKPSLIIIRSHIGFGSPKQDSASAHGEPLGPEAARTTKRNLGWPLEPAFYIPEEARDHFMKTRELGGKRQAAWEDLLRAYRRKYPDLAARLDIATGRRLPDGWDANLSAFSPGDGPIATRSASGKIMNAIADELFNLVGGSADLAPSNKTLLNRYGDIVVDGARGRNIHFGVREFMMAAVVNGIALHGGLIPYGATFLLFSDYMRPALRLAAMMAVRAIFVFTHDSIALGQDGPTHQPVEQMMSLRAIPGLTVLRPADANETAACWRIAVERQGPVALLLTRQNLPVLDTNLYPIREGVRLGGYVLKEPEEHDATIVLIATGSEVHLVLEATRELNAKGVKARVVSMPSWEIFDEQPAEYRGRILPPAMPKLAVEAGVSLGWQKYTGPRGDVIGIDRFGASAPGATAYSNLGFNVDNVVRRALALLGG
jgi:transketolase